MTNGKFAPGFHSAGAGTTNQGYAKCHHYGLRPVWNDANVYAGARDDLSGTYDVTLDCTGMGTKASSRATIPPVSVGEGANAERYKSLIDLGVPEALSVIVDWPDGGVPPVMPAFWGALVRSLGDDKLAVFCVGGHGRTGTALACIRMALLSATDAPPPSLWEIVDEIRRNHCDSAVETTVQCDYLRRIAKYFGVPHGDTPIYGSYSLRAAFDPAPTTTPVVDYVKSGAPLPSGLRNATVSYREKGAGSKKFRKSRKGGKQ